MFQIVIEHQHPSPGPTSCKPPRSNFFSQETNA
jgi:hypothetical protein